MPATCCPPPGSTETAGRECEEELGLAILPPTQVTAQLLVHPVTELRPPG